VEIFTIFQNLRGAGIYIGELDLGAAYYSRKSNLVDAFSSGESNFSAIYTAIIFRRNIPAA
jgi:hypothetical protein